MEAHLKISGVVLTLLALLHVVFPKYFKWRMELSLVSHINRQMMYIHTFFIAFGVLLMAILCFTSADEIIHTKLGQKVAFGLGIFWAVRLFIQFFGYSSLHWKGKQFETAVHLFFAILWAYLSFVFFFVAYA